MSEQGVDNGRRHFLTVATVATGAVGAVAAAIPFAASFSPSERAQALGAPVEVDISKLKPGEILRVEWRGRPVFIIHRTERLLESLDKLTGELRDPDSEQPQQPSYADNPYRSIRPEIFVTIGNCTHLGCAPQYRPEVAPEDLGSDWLGGFFCPCHGSKFDMAGRVYAGVPAQLNLVVPPYRFLSESLVLVGEDKGVAA